MPAAALAAIAPKQVVQFCKNPVWPFFIIVQPFNKHFFLGREIVAFRQLYIIVDFKQAIFA